MSFNLSDLIDIEKTQRLLQNFFDSGGIPAAIIDLEGVVLVTSPWQRLCNDFHRVNEETCKRCIESDTVLANELQVGKTFSLYRCQNGLTDAASPIIIEGNHVANAFIGQFFTEKPDVEFFRRQAKEHGFDEREYLEALSEIPIIAEKTLPSILSFLTSFAEMIASLGLKQLQQLNIEKELREAQQRLQFQNKELRESQEDLNRAQAVAHIGSWRMDVKRNIMHWSDETYRMFGIPKGLPLTYEAFLADVHPDDREMVDQSWQAALCGTPYDIEHRILVGDTAKWVHVAAELEFDEEGALRGRFGTIQDITESKQTEEKLLRAKQEWERTFDSVPDLIAVIDTQHRIVRANGEMAKRLGKTTGQVVGLHCYKAIHCSASPPDFCPHTQTLHDGQEHVAEVHEERLGGDFLVSTTPLRDEYGQMIGTVHVARDITERKRMEDELRKSRDELDFRVQERTTELATYTTKLEQSNEALQDFAFIASHDMKEPLRKVISFGNLLRQKHKDTLGPAGNDYLNRMLDATQRMQSLLTSLLEYSRVTMNQEPFQEADLYDLVHEVLSDLEVKIEKTGGEVQVGELPVVAADPSQMRQLFQNLIGNALKFHKPGEKPIVRVVSAPITDSGCRIIVEDNGIGFEEKYLERIFAPFQRLHDRSSQYEGTGMGLAICKRIVERHGGVLAARSEPGKGSTFILTLPAKRGQRT
ncbi:MAG: PocR ligand-binding domain-containing protein [Syntrophobacteraceae bacterium]